MRVLYVTVFIIVADQISKMFIKGIDLPLLGIAIQGMQLGQSVPVLGNFLRITFIENPGMAFGIEVGGKLFLTLFSVAASVAILIYLYAVRNESLVFRISLAMILGGAVGNLIDRVFYGVLYGDAPLFYGKVVDFIDVDFFTINFMNFHLTRFWVFNIADASVTIGVLLMLIFHRTIEKEGTQAIDQPQQPLDSAPSHTESTPFV